jgi:uncharacterized membrane protein YoaK (UPF0700 family)
MIQSLRAVAVLLIVASVAVAGYFVSRWLGSPHELAMIFPALCITLLAHFAHRLDQRVAS